MNINIEKQLSSILKEGFLQKESRFLKSWRKRWFVLTPHTIMSFKQRKVYQSATEIIILKDIISIKSCEEGVQKEFSFRIHTEQASFVIAASSTAEKELWINQIGKAMVKINSRGEEDD